MLQRTGQVLRRFQGRRGQAASPRGSARPLSWFVRPRVAPSLSSCRTFTEFLLKGESVMCAPSVIQTALAGLSRRELLQISAGLAAGMALAPPALKAADEPAVRSIGLSKVVDLTHTLG